MAPLARAKASRRSASGSHTPAHATSSPEARSILEWNVAIRPAPRKPTRTVISTDCRRRRTSPAAGRPGATGPAGNVDRPDPVSLARR